MSARSGNLSLNLSRASSVDTMNTDGLGTPLELTNPTLPSNGIGLRKNSTSSARDQLTAALLAGTQDQEALNAEEQAKLQMTQVGYEDPEAGMWRARLMRKAGRAEGENGDEDDEDELAEVKGKEMMGKASGTGTVLKDEGWAVSRRTRRSGKIG